MRVAKHVFDKFKYNSRGHIMNHFFVFCKTVIQAIIGDI